VRPFRFGVVCNDSLPREAWCGLARKVEDLGYATLLASDHLGTQSTFARLLSAANMTSVLRVGTYVLNNDFFHPLRLAQEAATVDELSGGRLELGIGAGWARPEYDRLGVAFDALPVRAKRLAASLETIKTAWADDEPRPVQVPHPPILVGGQSDAVLQVAARQAGMVGLTGATMIKGSFYATAATVSAVAERVEFVRSAAGERAPEVEFNVRVESVFVSGLGPAIIRKVSDIVGMPPRDVAESPFALIGTAEEIIERLHVLRERLGLSYYVVSAVVADDFAPVVAALSGR
jgi:probable F420-dependent oxidoreductase